MQISKFINMIIAIDLDDTVADTTGAQCEALGISPRHHRLGKMSYVI